MAAPCSRARSATQRRGRRGRHRPDLRRLRPQQPAQHAGQDLRLISLLASVNLLLFFFNLLPLLPLDGGHVAGAIVESVKRGRARLRARGQPPVVGADGGEAAPAHRQIFVDTAQMLPVMYAVASVLIVLTLLTLYADIVKPINPFGG